MVLKIHRYTHISYQFGKVTASANTPRPPLDSLGRISFRAIKEKRDYMGRRKSASWMYMSRLAAEKEWAFLKVRHGRTIFLTNGRKYLFFFFPLTGST